MRRWFFLTTLGLAMAGGQALAPAARAQDRSVDQIVKDLDKVEMPKIDPAKRNDRAAVVEYLTKRQQAMADRAKLIGELYKKDPKNEKLVALLPERWQALLMAAPGGAPDDLKNELAEVSAKGSAKLKVEAAYWSTIATLRGAQGNADAMIKALDTFSKAAPTDERGAILLYSVGNQINDSAKQAELYRRVVKEFPKSQVAKMVEGSLKQLDAVGKPFVMDDFQDAINNKTVSMKALKGKVVVIDFWATWCGPCVAEMPHMKELYAKFKPQGVEFIGVSLDQPKEEGGLDKLKDFVAKNEITWPQYYQGKGWESEFSRGWGINAIPAVFIVDTEGKLASINARGKLEEMIPDLLKKAKTPAAGAGGH